MDFFGHDLTVENFFRHYWRQRPLHIPGGAGRFIGRTWSTEDFDESYQAIVSDPGSGAAINERPDDVTFIEKVSEINSDLSARMALFSEAFGTPLPWCDTIRTYRPSGIGSHFDHSDNFVLQQAGVKRWRLAPPSNISEEEYVARLMGNADVGQHELPDTDVFEVDLKPGDLLYIPLMWIHSGVSEEESLSLSVVCPTVTVYSAVVTLLSRIMRVQNVGHQVLDAVPSWLPESERIESANRIKAVNRAIADRMSDPAVLGELERVQAETCFPGLAVRDNHRI